MTPVPTFEFWWRSLSALGLEVALVLALAALGQSLLRSPRRRRAVWLGALTGLALVLGHALSGADLGIYNRLVTMPAPARQVVARANLPANATHGTGIAEANESASTSAPGEAGHPGKSSEPRAVWWPVWVWIAGAVAFGLWSILPRLWLAGLARRRSIPLSSEAARQVGELAARLGLRRPVRVVCSSRLAGPVAFGVLRPRVGVPADFWTANSRAERDAMLAHELGHLVARDPFWLGFADSVAALLWWHPLVWWARRQFRAASEAVADEASLVVEDGPAVLAGCLVALATRWQQGGVLGLLGMAGFRSGLGQRVERLLRLRPDASPVPTPIWQRLLLAVTGTVTAATAVFASSFLLRARAESDLTLLAAFREAVTPSARQAPTAAEPTRMADPGGESRTPGPPAVALTVPGAKSGGPVSDTAGGQAPAARAEPATAGIPPKVESAPVENPNPTGQGARVPGPQAEVGPAPAPSQCYTRNFRVDPEALRLGLAKVTGDASTNLTVVEVLWRLFKAAGVELGETNVFKGGPGAAVFQSPGGKAVLLNEQNGLVLVRATLAELDAIEQLLEVVNAAPPQVTIEARFVAITQNDLQPVKLDWLFGQVPAGTNASAGTPGSGAPPGAPPLAAPLPGVVPSPAAPGGPGLTGSVATVTGLATDPQFRSLNAGPARSGTNAVVELRGDRLDWPGRQAPNAANVRVDAALGTALTGILTDPQYRVVLRALEQRSGVDILAAPKVTTLSGRQAQIQVVELKSVLTGLNPEALQQPAPGSTTHAAPFTTVQLPLGPTLDLLPVVAADGLTIELTVTPSVTEFLGYDPPPKDGKARVWEAGKSRLVDVPLPRFRVRQMLTQARVADGQTLVLGGLPTVEPEKDRSGQPRKDGRTVRKQLLVFITPTITDPAGNRVNPVDAPPSTSYRQPPAIIR